MQQQQAASTHEQSLPGLSTAEVEDRRARGLGCVPPPATGRSYLRIVRENVLNTINVILFSIALALVLLGQYLDALVSVGVISFNMVISLVQEVRAKRELDRIALLTRPQATVVRDGREQTCAPEALVVDDLLVARPGDQIVVDGPIVGAGPIQVDESLLTGESTLVSKREGEMLYSGTFCVTGSTMYRAEKVGVQSMAGSLTARARAYREVYTPLQSEINLVIRVLLFVALFLELLLFASSIVSFIPIVETVRMAMVVIGIVPNGLFLCISVAYALGAVRIVGKGALVQKFNAIESLSHVDVLCLDKTGTLTANALELSALQPYGIDTTLLRTLLGYYTAHLTSPNKTSQAIGRVYQAQQVPSLRVLQEVPFSPARKWSALVMNDAEMRGSYVLGAPDVLQPFLAPGSDLGTFPDEETKCGRRVLLFASTPELFSFPSDPETVHLPSGLVPLGAISLGDTLRPEARETLARFIALGVQVKIISGDHPRTVAALAAQVGLDGQGNMLTGTEVDKLDDGQLGQAVEETTICGRITPRQKERLVRALRDHHHYVAMIGDGVNDVLSLKQAQLGIAMQSGSQATRGVADIVLLRDSFAALPAAVGEGQRIRNGMQDIFKLFLARVASMTLLLVAIAFIGSFPFQPRQTSLLTLLTVGVPALALAYWARPGRVQSGNLLGMVARFVLPVAVTICLVAVGVYIAVLVPASLRLPVPENPYREGALPIAQTALTIFLVLCGLILLLFVEPPTRARPGGQGRYGNWWPALMTLGLFLCLLMVLAVPPLRSLFNLVPLSVREYGIVAGGAILWAVLLWLTWHFQLVKRLFGVTGPLGG